MAKGACNGGPPVTARDSEVASLRESRSLLTYPLAWDANPTEGCIAKEAPSKPTRGYIAKEATSNRPKGTSLRERRPGAGLAHVDPVPS